jgi:hypothetical protein
MVPTLKPGKRMRPQRNPFLKSNVIYFLPLALTMNCWTSKADAMPELTRHGYASCTACHVSPNGGGILTPYGRGLSRELLSTWGTTREAEVAHGILPKNWAEYLESSKLRLGGDARWVQTHRENSLARSGQFFAMQAQAEVAWDEGPWAIVTALGKIEDPRGQKSFRLVSPKYFGLLRFSDSGGLRLGRFNPAFGLNLADHTLSVRRALGIGPDTERDNFEAFWLGEENQFFLTISASSQTTPGPERERAILARYERIIHENSRIGFSFWQGAGGESSNLSQFERWIFGIHGIAHLSKRWFLSGELDRVEKIGQVANQSLPKAIIQSQYAFLRLNYEPLQGIWPLLQYQHERGDISLSSSETNKLGLGINFFPRPHWELFGIWNRVARPSEWSDEAYLVVHYYL